MIFEKIGGFQSTLDKERAQENDKKGAAYFFSKCVLRYNTAYNVLLYYA